MKAFAKWGLSLLCLVAVANAGAEAHRLPGVQQPGWYSYEQALQPGMGSPCCQHISVTGALRSTGCRLESGSLNFSTDASLPATAVERGDRLRIYVQYSDQGVQALHAYGADCPVETDQPVTRLSDISVERSVEWLSGLSQAQYSSRSLRESSVAALALHAGTEADSALIALDRPEQPRALREAVLFWLAIARGEVGAERVLRAAREDPSPAMRKHATFALSQTEGPQRGERLRRIAHDDASAEVRGNALFWIAQVEGAEAMPVLLDAVRRETGAVQEQAVFALSQIGERADEALIAVVRGDFPRSAKKQALFWLGQSGSDTALAFLDEVLSRGR